MAEANNYKQRIHWYGSLSSAERRPNLCAARMLYTPALIGVKMVRPTK